MKWRGFTVNPALGTVVDAAGKSAVAYMKGGYPVVRKGGKAVMLGRLVWESVHGPIAPGLFVSTINGDPRDCRLENLRLSRQRRARVGTKLEDLQIDPATGDVLGPDGSSRVKVQLPRGHAVVWLGNKAIMVGRLIWEHVHGQIPEGRRVLQRNGDRLDNRIDNLMLSTPGFSADPTTGVVYGSYGQAIMNRDKHGYIIICCGRARKNRLGLPTYGHQFVWQTVHGPIAPGMTINHLNGIKDDNRIENLELVTQSDNMHHAYRTGLIDKVGEAHHMAKLNEEKVLFIRANAFTYTDQQMADMFGVCKETIRDARTGKNWPHLPGAIGKK
jgi:hypothetical protein